MQKLDCKDVRRLIDAFQDNEVDGIVSMQIQDHFDSCPDCRSRKWWREETVRALSRLKERAPTPSARLRSRVIHIPEVREPGPRKLVPVLYQAAAVFMTAFLLIFFMFSPLGYSGMDAQLFVQSHKAVDGHRSSDTALETADPREAAAWLRRELPGIEPPRDLPTGYSLKGVRVVEIEGKSTGLLLYESDGRKLSCFVRAGGAPVDRGFEEITLRENSMIAGRCRGHQIVTWLEASGPVVLVGDLAEDSMVAFAQLQSTTPSR